MYEGINKNKTHFHFFVEVDATVPTDDNDGVPSECQCQRERSTGESIHTGEIGLRLVDLCEKDGGVLRLRVGDDFFLPMTRGDPHYRLIWRGRPIGGNFEMKGAHVGAAVAVTAIGFLIPLIFTLGVFLPRLISSSSRRLFHSREAHR